MMYYQVLLLVCCIVLATGEDGCQHTSGLSWIDSLNCTNEIPKNIPTRTSYLHMYLYFTNTSVSSVTFSHDSGRLQGADSVRKLWISCKDNDQTILHVKSRGLSTFHNLFRLSLDCANIILDKDAFEGLHNHINIDLTIYNEIPTHIPTRTSHLYLYFTNTSIPSITFNNESGRLQGDDNVRELRIRCKDNHQTALHVKSGGLSKFHNLHTLSLECSNIILDEDAFEGLPNHIDIDLTIYNEIPTHIPTRTRNLYLYFTNTSIPSITFNNESGRLQGDDNVRELEIRCKDNDQTALHVKSGGLSKFHNLLTLSLECSNIKLHENAFYGLLNLRSLTIYNEIPVNIPTSMELLFLHLTNTSIPYFTFSNESGRLQGADNVWELEIRCKDNDQTTLHLTSGGLSNFHDLQYLYLKCAKLIVDKDALSGLTNLESLKIYSATILSNNAFLSNINADTLPNLQKILLNENGHECHYTSFLRTLRCRNGIPLNIPPGTRELYLYLTDTSIPTVTFSNESGHLQGADNVNKLEISCRDNNKTAIYVKSGGFSNFHNLQFLYLKCAKLIVDKDAFSGLTNLHTLKIYSARNLSNHEFLSNRNTDTITNLQTIFLHENGHVCHYTSFLWTLRCSNEIPLNILSSTIELYLDLTSTSVPYVMFRNDSQQLQGADNVEYLSIQCQDNNQTMLYVKSGGLSKFDKLKSLTIECVKIILEQDAFDGLTYLENLTVYNKIPINIPTSTNKFKMYFTNTSIDSVTFRNDSQRLQGTGNVNNLTIRCKDNNQTTLYVKSGGLSNFHKLKELTLECANIKLEKYAFYGLRNLKRLSIYDSVNLSNKELLSNLYPETLKSIRIRYITLQNTGLNYDDGFNLTALNWEYFGTSLEKVGFTEMNISELVADDDWYHSSVKYNIQRSSISTLVFYYDDDDHKKGKPIPYLDKGESNTVRNMRMHCIRYRHCWKYGYEIHVPFTSASVWNFENNCYANVKTLMITNLNLRDGFQFNPGKVFNVTELSIRKCHLKNISNPLFTREVNLTKLSLSSNNIGFIHPDTFKMSASLIHLDLSTNNLQNMNRNNRNLFEQLFSPLHKLQTLNLQQNSLSSISAELFIDNTRLKSIDLSKNYIFRLTFLTEGLDQLTYINLKNNSINHIDGSILDRLDLLCLNKEQDSKFSHSGIVLEENHFGCSSCVHNELISWIQKNRDCLPSNSSITCYDEDGILTNIFTKHRFLCITEIIAIAIAVLLIFLIATIVTCIIKRKRPGLKAHFGLPILGLPMNHVNRPPCKYFVFLAYSSQDEEFVNNKVKPELIEGLKARIKDDIEPVCIGDKFRVGFSISDEIITCIEQSKAVLVLLTDHYCRSDYCVIEFQRAIQLHKPVIVMVKDKVDQSLMTPEMKLHYKTNTRIIWKWENGDYVLKSSWKIICDSLINLDRRA